jgi:hypothetical protein
MTVCVVGSNLCVFVLQHHEQVQKYSSTLETLLFTQDLDPHILEVFQQFRFIKGLSIFIFTFSL